MYLSGHVTSTRSHVQSVILSLSHGRQLTEEQGSEGEAEDI